MSRTVAACALLLVSVAGCDGDPGEVAPPPRDARSDAPPTSASPDLVDPEGGMTLRLPAPGATRAAVLDAVPGCAEQLERDGDRCRFHGWIRPLPRPCEDGCTWWTYRFVDDRLDVATLERAVWDVDREWAARFTEQARRVAAEITARAGVDAEVDRLATWANVEAAEEGQRVRLERRTWSFGDRLVTWTLTGTNAHHPGIELTVRVESAHPDALRVEALAPGLQTGAALLRLRGGPVPRPLEVPMWLTFDARDAGYDNCALHHEAMVFALPDGRVYVGQYNSWCGGPRQCRVIDPRTGATETPAGGCLWGDGIHHRATAIGDGWVLLTSDAEGTGAIEIVRYDPDRGERVALSLSLSSMAPLHAEARDGGVDFTTVCELPPGCEHREYGEVPARRYRWTPASGLTER